MDRVRLVVKGISGSNNKPEIYVLILGEQGEGHVFPVIMGFYEAQSIAFCLENSISKRPFIHDLFFELSRSCNIEILEVFINDFRNSSFFSEILCFNGKKYIKFNARLSDAVALALRFKCPIFTTKEVLSMVGVNISQDNNNPLGHLSLEELLSKLNEAVRNENYEMAITLRNEIKRRKQATNLNINNLL
ncbi:MAG: bifunctional nuclease family protein [Prevotellaceae bacterium]|jgi:bifunctional DNase/RNase|nr:bifunctional nuclease family protein [Prevotellaceae bacterium]